MLLKVLTTKAVKVFSAVLKMINNYFIKICVLISYFIIVKGNIQYKKQSNNYFITSLLVQKNLLSHLVLSLYILPPMVINNM